MRCSTSPPLRSQSYTEVYPILYARRPFSSNLGHGLEPSEAPAGTLSAQGGASDDRVDAPGRTPFPTEREHLGPRCGDVCAEHEAAVDNREIASPDFDQPGHRHGGIDPPARATV